MANVLDIGEAGSSNLVQGNGTNVAVFTMPAGVALAVESVLATINNAAGGDTEVLLTIKDQSGEVIAEKRQNETFPAGDTGTATWSLRDDDNGGTGTAAGFIKYDFENDGDWLHVTTESTHGAGAIVLDAVTGGIRLAADDPLTGQVALDAAFIRFDPGAFSLRLLDTGEVFWEADGVSIDWGSDYAIDADQHVFDLTSAAGKLIVKDRNGNEVLRIDQDGTLHGKTGKALVFDL